MDKECDFDARKQERSSNHVPLHRLWHTHCSLCNRTSHISDIMNRIYLFPLAVTALLLSGCKKTSITRIDPGQLVTPQFAVSEGTTPFTGALDIYPCEPGTSVYYGNYIGDRLTPFNALYTISGGSVHNALRPVLLPVGDYSLIYWGVSQAQEPTYTKGAVMEPSLSLNGDLARQDYTLRKYPTDTTYYPVYDFVYANQTVDIGAQSIAVSLKRVVSGLTVILQKEDGSKLDPEIASINILIGNIAEDLNFDTGEPENQTKTVRFPITITDDSLTAANPVALVFPSAPNPPLKIVLTLKNGTERTFRTQLENTLTANTKLTVTVNMGEIFSSETEAGGFRVGKWEERNETVTTGAGS